MAPNFSRYEDLKKRRKNEIKQKINELLIPVKQYCRSNYNKFVNKVLISGQESQRDQARILFDDDADADNDEQLSEKEKAIISLWAKDEAEISDKNYKKFQVLKNQ